MSRYTTDTFLGAFANLLLAHPWTHTVRLRLAGEHTALHRGDGDALANAVECVVVHAELWSMEDAPGDARAGGRTEVPHGVARHVIAGHPSRLTARWCAELQRVCCVQSLLVGRASTAAGSTPSRGVSRFEVHLFPYVPELTWCRDLDGVLGAQQYTVTHAVIVGSVPRAADGGCEEDAVGSIPPQAKRRRLGRGAAHSRSPSQECWDEGDSACGGTRRYACRVGALLNANAPGSGVAGTMLMILHAPGTQLVTASLGMQSGTVTPPGGWHAPSMGSGNAEGTSFAFMKTLIAQKVVPRMSLEGIGAAWGKPHDTRGGEAVGSCYDILPCTRSRRGCCGTSLARVRNVLLILDIPPELWDTLAEEEQQRTTSKLTETVVPQLARALEAALVALAATNLDSFMFSKGPQRLAPADAADTEEMGDAAVEGTDSQTTAATPQGTTASATTFGSRLMLIRTIAESIAHIIIHSPHRVFVRASEDLLFGRPNEERVQATDEEYDEAAGGARGVFHRFSESDIRWAIESKLRRLT